MQSLARIPEQFVRFLKRGTSLAKTQEYIGGRFF